MATESPQEIEDREVFHDLQQTLPIFWDRLREISLKLPMSIVCSQWFPPNLLINAINGIDDFENDDDVFMAFQNLLPTIQHTMPLEQFLYIQGMNSSQLREFTITHFLYSSLRHDGLAMLNFDTRVIKLHFDLLSAINPQSYTNTDSILAKALAGNAANTWPSWYKKHKGKKMPSRAIFQAWKFAPKSQAHIRHENILNKKWDLLRTKLMNDKTKHNTFDVDFEAFNCAEKMDSYVLGPNYVPFGAKTKITKPKDVDNTFFISKQKESTSMLADVSFVNENNKPKQSSTVNDIKVLLQQNKRNNIAKNQNGQGSHAPILEKTKVKEVIEKYHQFQLTFCNPSKPVDETDLADVCQMLMDMIWKNKSVLYEITYLPLQKIMQNNIARMQTRLIELCYRLYDITRNTSAQGKIESFIKEYLVTLSIPLSELNAELVKVAPFSIEHQFKFAPYFTGKPPPRDKYAIYYGKYVPQNTNIASGSKVMNIANANPLHTTNISSIDSLWSNKTALNAHLNTLQPMSTNINDLPVTTEKKEDDLDSLFELALSPILEPTGLGKQTRNSVLTVPAGTNNVNPLNTNESINRQNIFNLDPNVQQTTVPNMQNVLATDTSFSSTVQQVTDKQFAKDRIKFAKSKFRATFHGRVENSSESDISRAVMRYVFKYALWRKVYAQDVLPSDECTRVFKKNIRNNASSTMEYILASI